MHDLPSAEEGISRLKIVQKSLGVMSGKTVGPNAVFGFLALMGTWNCQLLCVT